MAIRKGLWARMAGLAAGGWLMITTASCDPYTGTFDLFRDDDNEFGFVDFYYDDGCFDCCCFDCFDCGYVEEWFVYDY